MRIDLDELRTTKKLPKGSWPPETVMGVQVWRLVDWKDYGEIRVEPAHIVFDFAKNGNYFPTKEEAEKAASKVKKLLLSLQKKYQPQPQAMQDRDIDE